MNKYIYKSLLIAGLLIGITACSDDDSNSNFSSKGTPSVRYVRPCDTNVADSLLVSAFLGEKIAIIGDNLS